MLSGSRRTGTIKALEDSKVVKIDRETFKVFYQNFLPVNDYFKKYLDKNFKKLDIIILSSKQITGLSK